MTTTTIGTQPVALEDLESFPGNARRGNVDLILDSLRANGQYKPLTVRRQGETFTVLAGNHTLLAMLRHEEDDRAACADWELANDRPCQLCIAVDRDDPTALAHLIECDDATATRINLVDNRAADTGDYDAEALAALLASLEDDQVGTGYAASEAELFAADAISGLGASLDGSEQVELSDAEVASDDDEDERDVPLPPLPAEPVTQRGDVWLLGPHRILCGDCRDPQDVDRLLGGVAVNIAFTSPPYASRRKYDETSGFKPIPPDEYVAWFEEVQARVREHLADDGSWFVNIKEHTEEGYRHLYVKDLTITHVRQWGWGLVDELVWYHGGTPGKFVGRFKNGWEPVFHFAASHTKAIKHRPSQVAVESDYAFRYARERQKTGTGNIGFYGGDVERMRGLAFPSNVLALRNGRHVGDNAGTIGHEAAFTVRLPEWFIKAYTDAGDAVYDPFMGSGSTLLAAHRNDRVAYGTEISPAYCDVVCRRFQQITGTAPVLERTGEERSFLDGDC